VSFALVDDEKFVANLETFWRRIECSQLTS